MNKTSLRTHTCGQLTIDDKGKKVTLCGFLHSIRDLGSVVFFVLRDFYGITQVMVSDEKQMQKVREFSRESTLSVVGKVIERSSPNPNIPTGLIEIEPTKIEILGACSEVLPFEIDLSLTMREDTRLKYRFLDMRNQKVKDKLVLRSKIVSSLRKRMIDKGFLEITTPILTSSSPEGARDFIVPSRLHHGQFYALPQAPQQFKQLLMAGGFDKYFQIAPCFRDEDARADRSPGEFYQLDLEMAFASQEDVFELVESVIPQLFEEFTKKKVDKPPFRRISYKDSLNEFGSDKPDFRNPLRIIDAKELLGDKVPMFENKGVKVVIADNFDKPRSFIDKDIIETAKGNEIEGIYWVRMDANADFVGGVAKFLVDIKDSIADKLKLKANSFMAIVAHEKNEMALKQAGFIRNLLGEKLDLIDKNSFNFCWVVDYPMYELDDDGKVTFSHNPFSMPQGGKSVLTKKDPLDILAYQYDLVCNGIELSSGAVRNYCPDTMVKAFKIAGYDKSVIEEKFSALFNAFKFGAPPHAGIAPGLDRMVMLLLDEPNIREVIAFPMNKSAQDLLMGAPNAVNQKQLDEVGIKIK
ncbi:MAG: aspartate--tRNA ligase [Firmicutes bacterium]|nr:aspartate--tRNA ligase [Bacillota bacterium]